MFAKQMTSSVFTTVVKTMLAMTLVIPTGFAAPNTDVSGPSLGRYLETDEKAADKSKNKSDNKRDDEDELSEEDLADLGLKDLDKDKGGIRRKDEGTKEPARATIKALDKSSFPEMTCQLIDNRPHLPLLEAARKLEAVLTPPEECKNNSDLTQVTDNLKTIINSAGGLQNIWGSSQSLEGLDPASAKVKEFQDNLTKMIGGINNVTNQLQQNSFFSGRCGGNLLTKTGLISAVSDLVTSFAPYALIGASLNPSMKIALPFILGISGVGSVAKIVKNISDKTKLNTDKAEVREAILKNICEYNKISQKIRFLKLAQSGQLNQVTSEIQKLAQRNQKMLRSQYTNRVAQLYQSQRSFDLVINEQIKVLRDDVSKLTEIDSSLAGQEKGSLTCAIAAEVAKSAQSGPNEFPARTLTNYKNSLEKNQKWSAITAGLYKSTLAQQDRLQKMTDQQITEGTTCIALSESYIRNLRSLIKETGSQVEQFKSSFDQKMLKDKEYSQFRMMQLASKNEIEHLQKVSQILEGLNADNSVIDKSELDTHLFKLKHALFGGSNGLYGFGSEQSPAMAWLDFVDTQFNRSIDQFEKELTELKRDVYAITKSGRGDIYQRDEKGQIMKDQFGQVIRLGWNKQTENLIRDLKSSDDFIQLTPKLTDGNKENKRLICQRLENIWLNWHAANDHLSAQDFFCKQIQQHVDKHSAQPSLFKRCINEMSLDGRVIRRSEIAERFDIFNQKQYAIQAGKIGQKLQELSCDMPTNADVLK